MNKTDLLTVDFSQPSLHYALLIVFLAPTIWNILARIEYNTHLLTKLACGNKYWGCYMLAVWIFFFSLYRDYVFKAAMADQAVSVTLTNPYIKMFGGACIVYGTVLVLTSMYRLGVTGTYLGDYFGIYMDARVTGFPFNVTEDPMYNGSSLCFLGSSLWYASPAGLVIAASVYVMYRIALMFEGPFTAMIYRKRDEANKKKNDATVKSSTSSQNQARTSSPAAGARKIRKDM
jgi:methylene-fatty-acyl-phospholipid synthase